MPAAALGHLMDSQAAFEHLVRAQIIERLLVMHLPQHALDDTVVFHPQNFHAGAVDGGIQAHAQIAHDLQALVNNFEPRPGIGGRQFENAA